MISAAAIFSDSGSAGGAGARAGAGDAARPAARGHERAALVRTDASAQPSRIAAPERATAREARARAREARGADARREGTRDGGHAAHKTLVRAAV